MSSPMKVVIFCGGFGTRIKEETEFKPKPMVAVGDRPMLWHIMKIYAHYGYKDFVLCLGYKGEIIKHYFWNYGMMTNDFRVCLGRQVETEVLANEAALDWNVVLADTGQKTLKGGRLKRIEQYIDSENFMVTYGDGLADIDIDALVKFHRDHKKIATVTGVRPPSRFGELLVDKCKVSSFTEKPQTSKGLINGGYFVFNRKLFDYLTPDSSCDFEKGPLEKLAADGELMMYEHNGTWECMDNMRDLDHLNELWDSGRAFWKVWTEAAAPSAAPVSSGDLR